MNYINKEGNAMDVYDFVSADTIESGDQILYQNDPVEVSSVIDSGEAIVVKGYSHLTGDSVTYILNSDTEVGLWTV